ncbi:MAG: hypothetical protein PVI30_13605 [Myxococcales bacterium]|jgi:long-subunit fatty acid transport protein
MRTSLVTAFGTAVAAVALQAGTAHAGGLEYTGQGSQSLARGGAVTARAEDPMVLAHNPAGLAELRGSHLMLNLNLALFDACVTPAGYYGWGVYLGGDLSEIPDPNGGPSQTIPLKRIDMTDPTAPFPEAWDYYSDPYDKVCLDQNRTPIPQLGWTYRVSEDLGIGFGLIFPSVQPSGNWGAKFTGVIRGDTGELRPAATRYQLLNSSNLGVFPNLGIGYRISEMLRVGVSLEYGLIAVNNYTMSAATGGTSPHNDIIAHIRAQDWFVPALTASVHLVPVDNIDVVAAFRWQDDVDASGEATLTSGVFNPAFFTANERGVKVNSVQQNLPWKLRAGIRYADRFAPRPVGTGFEEPDASTPEVIHDPLQDERWDVELDVEYQMNSRNERQFVDFGDMQRIEFAPKMPMETPPTAAVPEDITIEKQWQDQVSVRLGGTYNVFPGRVGVSAGVHYETRGVNPDFMQVDFWPVQRVGAHGGVLLRLAKRIDLVFAYAHIFQEDIIVAPPAHANRGEIYQQEFVPTETVKRIDKTIGFQVDRFMPEIGNEVREAPSQGTPDGTAQVVQQVSTVAQDQPPYITNAGKYTSSFDVLSVGVNVHF